MSQYRFEDIKNIEGRLDYFISFPQVNADKEFREQKLREFEKTIVKLTELSSLDPILLEHLLQFGTVIRRTNSNDLLATAIAVFECLAHEGQNKYQIGFSYRIRWLIFEGVRRCLAFDDFAAMGTSRVWKDELDEILWYFEKVDPFQSGDIKNFYNQYKEKFKIFRYCGAVNGLFWSEINQLISVMKQGQPNEKRVAQQALSYLVEEHDVIPDNLGLFGLVDDIEAIKLANERINPINRSQKIFQKIVSVDDSIYSMLIERSYSGLDNPLPLLGLSKPLQMCIGGTRYLLENAKNTLSVLPDRGMMLLPFISSYLLSPSSDSRKPKWINEANKTVYFNIHVRSVGVTYCGPAIDQEGQKIPGRVKISNGPDFQGENFTRFIPEVAMNFATLRPKYPNNCIYDATKISEWVEREHSFVPPHIHFKNRENQKLMLLTRKAEFLAKINEFKPFGVSIRDLVDFKYFSSSGKSEPICIRRLPGNAVEVDVFSNPGVLAEVLRFKSFEDDWLETQNIIVCDDEALAQDLLGMVAVESPQFDNTNFVFIAEAHQERFQSLCSSKGFQVFAIHGHIQGLIAGAKDALRDDATDALSRYENKISRALLPPNHNFIGFKHPEFDEFVRLFTETTSKIKKNEIPVGNETIFKAMKLKDALSSSWIPKSVLEKEELKQQIYDVAKSFAYNAQFLPEIRDLEKLLSESADALVNIAEARAVLEYVQNNSDQDFCLVEEFSTAAESANLIVQNESISNLEVRSLQSLRGFFLHKPIIVPYLPPRRSADLLLSSAFSNNIILFFSELEQITFHQRKAVVERHSNRLRKLTQKSFKETSLSDDFEKVNTNLKIDIPLPEPEADENVRGILRTYANKYSVGETKEVAEACPLFIAGGSKMLLLAPMANVIVVGAENTFSLAKAKDLKSGLRICIRASQIGDFLDEFAKYTSSNYSQIKTLATSWKTELKVVFQNRCRGEIERLRQELSRYGVERTEQSIRNWMNDDALIAPINPRETITKFCGLGFSSDFVNNLNEIISAIEKTYEMRRDASEGVLDALNSDIELGEEDRDFKLYFGNETLEFDLEIVEALGSQITIKSSDLGTIRKVG